jgi:tetratricopeptide (TPR) repeat protein
MVGCEQRDVVCLYLAARERGRGRTAASAASAAAIGDALELGDTVAGRVGLLDDLGDLADAGLVEREARSVEGQDAPRTVYRLTDDGRGHAAAVREELADETVAVGEEGSTETVRLGDVGRYLEDAAEPMVTALARLTEDDRVPLETTTGDAFVDREDALEAVRSGIEASFTREPHTVVVGGAAGMGKTALVREAIDEARAAREGLLATRGECPPEPTRPYEPLRRAFERLPDGDDLLARLAAAGEVAEPTAPEELHGQRLSLFDDVADALRSVARDRPVVLFVDNLQWADQATLDLFAHLATTIEEWVYPFALVGAYREPAVAALEDHPLPAVLDDLEAATAYEEVELTPLARSDTRVLLRSALGHHRTPESFVDSIHDRTGGNPLFVRETATHLLESGRVDPDAGSFPDDPTVAELPDAVTERIDRRLRALDDRCRELVELGAVLGERVPARVLAAASDVPPAERREYVDVLVAARVWQPVGDGQAAAGDEAAASEPAVTGDGAGDLAFVSGALREAVVERLPPSRTREYHGRIAAALVDVHGQDDDGSAARVAHHHEAAGDHERAVEYYRRAGDHARDTYAHETATDHYERALALADEQDVLPDEERATVHADLADAYRAVGEYDDARESVRVGRAVAPEQSRVQCRLLGILADARTRQGDYDRAREAAERQRELAAEVGADDLEAEANRWLAQVAEALSEYDRAREHARRSLSIERERDDRSGEATSLNRLGVLALLRDDHDTAEEYVREALAVAREADARKVEAQCLNDLGAVAYERSEYERAREYHEEALPVKRDIGDRHGEAKSLGNLGLIARRQGDLEEAGEYHERGLAIERDLGDRHGEAKTLGNLGLVEKRRGNYDDAREYFRRSLAVRRELGDRLGEARTLNNLGLAAKEQGRYGEAREQFEESLSIKRDIGDERGEARTRGNLADVARLQGEYERAVERYERSLALRHETGDARGEAETLVGLGTTDRLRDRRQRARERHEAARECAREHDLPVMAARARLGLGVLARERGAFDRAEDHLEAALATLAADGAPPRVVEGRLERGRLALARGDVDGARERATAALETAETVGATHWCGRCRLLLGRVEAADEMPGEAREHWRGALETAESVGAPQDALRALRRLVEHHGEHGDPEQVAAFRERAREVLADAPASMTERHREWVRPDGS